MRYESIPDAKGRGISRTSPLALTRDSTVYLVRMSSVSEATAEDSARHFPGDILLDAVSPQCLDT